MTDFNQWFDRTENTGGKIARPSIEAVLRLAAEGSTIPFIARYRKEQTGNLDEVGIQTVLDAKERWDQLIKRQAYIVGEIEAQGKLTPELKQSILGTFDADALEDLYLPYKKKRQTKAQIAREAGLQELADWIWDCGHGTRKPEPGQTLELWALTFRNDGKGIKESQDAIQGATEILVERLSELQPLRQAVRDAYFKKGHVVSKKGAKAKASSKFESYFSYQEPIEVLLKPENSHRYLAARRGWTEEELLLTLGAKQLGEAADPDFEAELLQRFEGEALALPQDASEPEMTELVAVRATLQKAARLAFKVYVAPSIENEVHKALKDVADVAAIQVFAENVRKLLLASPFGSKSVLGVDPGIRTGCKIAVVDASGKYVASTVMHLQGAEQQAKAAAGIVELVGSAKIEAIAVGNGTAGRETEAFLRKTLKAAEIATPVVMVSEAGASVYSASAVAREEFPDLDLTVRGAISIARRLQDPLAELVKVDPKSIGVGQYQHDVSQPALKRSLEHVVDSCVNSVGVNLNTASVYLLSHVSGIGPGLAKAVVDHRNSKGLFKTREELKDVSRFTAKAFELAAGFLRIPGGDNPLDNTGVHPERYETLTQVAKKSGHEVAALLGSGAGKLRAEKSLRDEVGAFTFDDIVRELEKPGRDPRETFQPFSFREDIFEVKDLQPGMVCPGIVTNVTNFGAFVDIGVHQDGLVHLSQLAQHYVKDPRSVVNPGDRVQVKVLEVNLAKGQISLTMRTGERPQRSERPARAERGAENRDRPRAASGGSGGPGKGKPRPPSQPQQPPRPTFKNNPFAGLASLKKDLKR